MSRRVRHSVIAGQWYPGAAPELRRVVEGYLTNVEHKDLGGEIVGLISPHAGYVYSGQVAAYAYDQVRGKSFDLVVVVAPVHRMYVGPYATTAADAYQTPLGDVLLDQVMLRALDERLEIARLPADNEHSLEIQLPFLQVALGAFKILPIMVGKQDWRACEQLANALGETLAGHNALLVASTDLSHFHPASKAEQLDQAILDQIDAFDPQGLSRALQRGDAEACGGGPVVAVMLAARELGADEARILQYAHSGHVTGDHSSVVGYAAGAIYRRQAPA